MATESPKGNFVILFGETPETLGISISPEFTGISIQVLMPAFIKKRITMAITKAIADKSINPENTLESYCKDFAKIRNIGKIEFICLAMHTETLSIIQTVYPPSDTISYTIIQSNDDALLHYAEYFVGNSPISVASQSSSSSTTPSPVLDDCDPNISRIPLDNIDGGKHIYLGNSIGANNKEGLQKRGITHIINITDTIQNYFEAEGDFSYLRIPIKDCGAVELDEYFPRVFEFIDKALETGGQIFIHCYAGISRSASFVIAYIMQHKQMKYDDAFQYVRKYRNIIEPNLGFQMQLWSFEDALFPPKP